MVSELNDKNVTTTLGNLGSFGDDLDPHIDELCWRVWEPVPSRWGSPNGNMLK